MDEDGWFPQSYVWIFLAVVLIIRFWIYGPIHFNPDHICDICVDSNNTLLLSCRHCFWCHTCTDKIFGLTRQSAWPVRCPCNLLVTLNHVQHFLTPDTSALITRRVKEWSIPGEQRLWCVNSPCNTLLIRTPGVKQNIPCTDCSFQTCSICRQLGHEGNCQIEETTQQTLATSDAQKYKRCLKCDQMIELNTGCQHITCDECSYEFCYLCGQPWTECRATCEGSAEFIPREHDLAAAFVADET